tara:strand:- start:77 stop:511 length:435 start_codon:yes stop_codon:yes gene_type:complete
MIDLVKIVVLKGGIQLISCVKNMEIGGDNPDNPDDKVRVIGYYLHSPCVIETYKTDSGDLDASMHPWIPATKDRIVPITAEQVVTIVKPVDVMSKMYMEKILEPSLLAHQEEERKEEIPSSSLGIVTQAGNRLASKEEDKKENA